MTTLSLHYTLDSQATQENDTNDDDIFSPNNSNDTNDTNDTNEINDSTNANGINKLNNEIEDGHFDPFAIEDNNKKFGEIKINTNESIPTTNTNESNPSNNENNSTPPLTQSSQSNDVPSDPFAIDENNKKIGEINPENNENNDENNDYDMDDMDDEEEEEEDEDLFKEMEENFAKAEKEKNNGLINILAEIKSKHKIATNNKQSSPNIKQNNYPKLKPLAFDGNLTITFDNINNNKMNTFKLNNINTKPKHFKAVAPNPSKKRKKMKNALKCQLSKTRKRQMRKHKKKFGHELESEMCMSNTNIYENDNDIQYENEHNETQREQSQQSEHKDEKSQEATPVIENESREATQEIEEDDIVCIEDNDMDVEDEEEEAYRAALVTDTKPKMSKELRELIDIDAEEENEHGEIITKFKDEYEEKHGIVKDLLCDKSEVKQLKKNKDIYDEKRNRIYNKLKLSEDDKDIELMKKAFIDGEYKQLQNKHKQNYNFLSNDNNMGKESLNFTSRNCKINYKNDPQYYLSDNEEKNDYCCYDENGLFYDVNIIRMKICEWNMKYGKNMLADDDEEDMATRMERQKRVQRKEMMANMERSASFSNKIEDKNAVKLLEQVRNKKKRRKPKLIGAATDFGGFYLQNGMAPLVRNNSTFMDHKEKCVEKVQLAESRSRMNGVRKNNIVSNGKRVVFKRVNSNSRKRMRNGNGGGDSNGCKKRRLQ